jgi:Patatin-like phospholipase
MRQVVVASGHMIDGPDRPDPRFPAAAEPRIAAAIAALFDTWKIGSGDIVVTQGARGTDVMVAEAALARDATSVVLLASEPETFIESSVDAPGTDWVDRFRRVLDASEVKVQTAELGALPDGENRYRRNNTWALEIAESATPDGLPLHVLAVWDRVTSAKPGGSSDFVTQARDRGHQIDIIDPTRTFRYRGTPPKARESRSDGPKRLLALDGGGMRGLITLQILRRMEDEIGGGQSDYRLADTFDYIAGTSTGAIIATALARGDRVDAIEAMYKTLGPKIFRKRWMPGWWRSLYKDGPITAELKQYFGADSTLGDDGLASLVMAVTHRTNTDSLWPLNNVSTARYNDRARKDCNLNLPLWQVVRGSSAAPVYFPPEEFQVGELKGVFQDGGVTPFNNPALLLYELATSHRYTLGWPTGIDDLLIVSVGTGAAPTVDKDLARKKVNVLFHARTLIRTIMNGSSIENDRLCRVLGHTRHGPAIDREFNAEAVDHIQPEHPLFTYVRYNAVIDREHLAKVPGTPIDAKRIGKLDAARDDDIDALIRVGQHAAAEVDVAHFAGFLP